MKIRFFRIVKIETPQEMQLDLAIASVSSKNIFYLFTSTRIFLDDPCNNIAIKLSLLSIAINVFHKVTIDSRINSDGYFTSGLQTGVCEAYHGGTPALYIKIRCWGLGGTRKVKK